jgi:hypothetical protein
MDNGVAIFFYHLIITEVCDFYICHHKATARATIIRFPRRIMTFVRPPTSYVLPLYTNKAGKSHSLLNNSKCLDFYLL